MTDREPAARRPIAVVVGRWTWRVLADPLGTSAPLVVPWAALGLTAVAVLPLANVVGLVPGRRAARTSAAVTLRSE